MFNGFKKVKFIKLGSHIFFSYLWPQTTQNAHKLYLDRLSRPIARHVTVPCNVF